MINNTVLPSIINNSDISDACFMILNFYDPNKNKNRKTKILNNSNIHIWTKNDSKYYDIIETKNLGGYAKQIIFDVILYEPPYNKSIFIKLNQSTNIFYNILNNSGFILCKVNDFKLEKNRLVGLFEVQDCFQENGFYLFDKIVYQHNKQYNQNNISYFLIFKKEI